MNELRQRLLCELDKHAGGYPTWWARHHLSGVTTAVARAEFKKMESEGLVVRSRRGDPNNNIIWVKAAAQAQGESKGGGNG